VLQKTVYCCVRRGITWLLPLCCVTVHALYSHGTCAEMKESLSVLLRCLLGYSPWAHQSLSNNALSKFVTIWYEVQKKKTLSDVGYIQICRVHLCHWLPYREGNCAGIFLFIADSSSSSSSSSTSIRPSGLLRFHSIFLTVFLGFFSHVVCSSNGCLGFC
jgi:hypothetical protein